MIEGLREQTCRRARAHLGETGILARQRWGLILVSTCGGSGEQHGEEDQDEWEAVVGHNVALLWLCCR